MKRLSAFLCIVLGLVSSASADGTLYDGQFDRPTHFPDFVRPRTWPNNMSYLVQAVTANGDTLVNYEVAVYDQNNTLRATGRSKTVDKHLCMLTISGTEGDTFHFDVLYGDFDDPTIRSVDETCSFKTNDVVGRDTPFWLTLPIDPTVAYWLGDVTAADPTDEVPSEEADVTVLRQATRIALKGSWKHESIADLLDSCTMLMVVELSTMPDSTAGAFTATNPNCLVYLPAGTTEAPEGWRNCIAGDKALTDIVLEDGTNSVPYPFHCPSPVALNDYHAIYSRTGGWKYADGNSGWNTVVVPFDAELQADGTAVDALTNLDLTSPQCNGSWYKEAGYWACPFLFSSEGDGLVFDNPQDDIAANTPYLFALPGKKFVKTIDNVDYTLSMEDREITFVSTGDSLPATPSSIVGEAEADYTGRTDAHFVGTYQVRLQQPMSLLKSQVADGYDAFVTLPQANLLPFRAYIEDMTGTAAGTMRPVNVGWKYVGTAITPMESANGEEAVYDLTGRRSDGAHGIVIINNKKMLLKP